MWTRILEMSSGYERDFITYLWQMHPAWLHKLLDQTAKQVLKHEMGSGGWVTGAHFYLTILILQWISVSGTVASFC